MSDNNIKVRKLGESKFFPIPESIKLQADSYSVYQNEEGMIIYVPKKNNPFKNGRLQEITEHFLKLNIFH
ncbi:hypothetical protein, partial [Companilactobacillus futsaii]